MSANGKSGLKSKVESKGKITLASADLVVNSIVRVADLTPHPRNYNTHDALQIEDLRTSLRRFGQVRSIVVQAQQPHEAQQPHGYWIVAGHGLVAAARLEAIETLRADVIPAGWDRTRVLAYLAADNELARRGMPDEAQLAAIVKEIEASADAELAALAAGAEDRLLELALLDTGELEGYTEEVSTMGKLGDKKKQIKPVLYCEDLIVFERAISQTGLINRGEALIEICRIYLNAQRTER